MAAHQRPRGAGGTNLITIVHHASETIDGQTSITIPINYGMVELITTGTNWSVINPPHMGSQVTNYCATNTVVQVNGAYVPAAGSLTPGAVLEATGVSNLSYSQALFYEADWPAAHGLVEWNGALSEQTTHAPAASGAIYVLKVFANTGGLISNVWMEYATTGTSLTAATTASISNVTGSLQDSGATIVEITTSAPNTFSTDYVITISGVTMSTTTVVNGAWIAKVIDSTHFTLDNSQFISGDSYVSGGTAVNSSNCVGIYGSTGAFLSATGDQVSNWQSGSLQALEMPLATAIPFTAGNTYYVAVVSKGSGSQPSFQVLNVVSTGFSTINLGLTAANYKFATNPGSGASRLNSAITLSSNVSTNNALFWVGLN